MDAVPLGFGNIPRNCLRIIMDGTKTRLGFYRKENELWSLYAFDSDKNVIKCEQADEEKLEPYGLFDEFHKHMHKLNLSEDELELVRYINHGGSYCGEIPASKVLDFADIVEKFAKKYVDEIIPKQNEQNEKNRKLSWTYEGEKPPHLTKKQKLLLGHGKRGKEMRERMKAKEKSNPTNNNDKLPV